VKTLAVWGLLVWERIGLARDVAGGQKQDAIFTVSGASSVGNDIDTAERMDLCLAKDDRRPGGYDPRRKRPRTVPRLVRCARRFMRVKTAPAMRERSAQSAG
jgi:hypothetical protein